MLAAAASLLLSPAAGGAVAAAPAGPWWRVALCEEGGRDDATYGYLGITPATWRAYGGLQFAPLAGGAAWRSQVRVAARIEGRFVPDQSGCAGAW